MANPWFREIWRVVILSLLAALFGLLINQVKLTLLITFLLYFSHHIYHLYQLERWLSQRDTKAPPEAKGIWGDVFSHIYRLQRRNRKRKRKLANMLTRFQESTAAMPDATLVLNSLNEIEWFNKAAKKLLELQTKKDIGQRIDNLIRLPPFVSYLIKGDYSQPLEIISHVNQDVRLSISIIGYGKNQKLMIARDISRLYQLETMRKDFVANVSHELKTPLTVISGYLENLLDDPGDDPNAWVNVLDQMKIQSFRMQQIVDDLLLLSRLETKDESNLEDPVAVPALIAAIVEDLQPLIQSRSQKINLNCANDVWLLGSEKELYSAFSNLIANAVKYTPDNGEISIYWAVPDNKPIFKVSDTGIGIHPDHLSRLTERFYRVDAGRSREQGGTGLGLAIVKHVLIRHQAKLDIESQLDKGSTFICAFDPKRLVLKQNNATAL